ncbi:MAG TPA: hypothetical protein PKA10_10480 [Selenomonadales bacterium]|nr:hypothetical protein [Selenomonadales bacterium]
MIRNFLAFIFFPFIKRNPILAFIKWVKPFPYLHKRQGITRLG